MTINLRKGHRDTRKFSIDIFKPWNASDDLKQKKEYFDFRHAGTILHWWSLWF